MPLDAESSDSRLHTLLEIGEHDLQPVEESIELRAFKSTARCTEDVFNQHADRLLELR